MNRNFINILAVTAGFFFLFMGFDGAQQYFIPLLTSQNRGEEALKAISLLYLCFFVTSFGAPFVIAKIGAARALFLGAVPYALFSFAVSSGSSWALYAACVLTGCGASLLWNASSIVVALSSGDENNGRNASWKYGALVIGGLIGVAVGALLLNKISLPELFLGFGISTAAGAVIFLAISLKKESTECSPISLRGMRDPKLLLLLPAVFCGFFSLIEGVSGLKLITLERFGLESVGYVGTLFKCGAVAGAFGAGPLADRCNKFVLSILMCVGQLVAAIIFVYAYSLTEFSIGVVLSGVCSWSVYPATQALIRERAGLSGLNDATGAFHIFSSAGMLAAFVAPLLFGAEGSFVILSALLLVTIPLLFLFERGRGMAAVGEG